MDEAIDWAERCPAPMPGEEANLELRPLFAMDDFGDEMTLGLRNKEEGPRAELEDKEAQSR